MITAELTARALAVTPDNFNRAESDMYFAAAVRRGAFGKFAHHRELMPIDKQTVVRSNRDTLYSTGVFDLEAAPVTITLPDAGPRFMSLQAIDEDQFTLGVVYGRGSYTYTREKVGTRYFLAGVRTLTDPTRPTDLEEVHALQDAIRVEQTNPGRFELPTWDKESQKRVRDALTLLAMSMRDTKRTFGTRAQVDPIRHLIGTAVGWGGNPETDACYLGVTPAKNDGTTVHRVTVMDVPVDGFWSISVYNAEGYFQKNAADAYSLNNLTARKNEDGSVTVHFGGGDAHTANYLPIVKGWNYMVRLYRPRREILNGSWTFPEAKPIA
jgi:hypothetical protein